MKAKIKERKMIADGTLQVIFELPQEVFFDAGQYFYLDLLNPPYNDAKGKERHFSIVSSPNQHRELTMATRLRDSAFKRSLNEMEIGTEVGIFGLAGTMILPKHIKQICMIAGGIGITPFMSMLQYIQEEKLDYDVVLLYSNGNQVSSAYREELEKMASEMENFRMVLTLTQELDWSGETGYIDREFVQRNVVDYKERFFMISGATNMVVAVADQLEKLSVPDSRILLDKFTGY